VAKFWISLVIGIFCVLAWLGGRQEAAETTKWPSVPGLVTDMNISVSHSSDGSINRTASVKYNYSVSGKPYQGDRIKVEASTDVSAAERYPKGTPVTVFYNPAHAEAAVLEPGGPGMLMWGLAGMGCLIYAGFALFRKYRPAPQSGKIVGAGQEAGLTIPR
jgi:hypothetical protein